MSKEFVENCSFLTPSQTYIMDYENKRRFDVEIENHGEEGHILATVGDNEPQRIDIEEVWQPVACRRYFLCPGCQKRAFKLYLKPGGQELKCRRCLRLRYMITTINKNTLHGKVLYQMNRMNKLSKRRAQLGTILYKGEYTANFKRFLRQCARAGYAKAVEDAAGLMTTLKNFRQV